MNAQVELIDGPAPSGALEWLEKHLFESAGWLTAEMICQASGERVTDRQVRACASASDAVISGARGYRHVEKATPEEIRHFIRDMESRAGELQRRAVATRRRAHALIG